MPYAGLIAEASRLGYPLDLLRLSLSSYLWPRRVVLDNGIAADPLLPGRGIVAGSAFATFELTAYLVASLRTLKGESPAATISMHVDDLSLLIIAATLRQAVRQLAFLGKCAVSSSRTGWPSRSRRRRP